jgi:hypothetical protein
MRLLAACILILGIVVALVAPVPDTVPSIQPVEIDVPNAAAAKRQLSEFLTFETVCAPGAANHVAEEGRQAFKGAHEVCRLCRAAQGFHISYCLHGL